MISLPRPECCGHYSRLVANLFYLCASPSLSPSLSLGIAPSLELRSWFVFGYRNVGTNNRRHQALIKKREQTDPGSSQPAETNEPTAAASNAMAAVAAPAQVLATAAPSSHAPSRAQHPIAALPGGIAFAASLQAPEIQDCPPHLASEPLKPETLQIQHSNLAQAGEIGIMDGTQMLYSSSLLSPPLPENHADGEAYLGVKYEHN